MRDIVELQENPYPNIHFHLIDLEKACLVLTPTYYQPLHLTICFAPNYPFMRPDIWMDCDIWHPYVNWRRVCGDFASAHHGDSPAYTLKSICIHLLSLFSSDSVEDAYGKMIRIKPAPRYHPKRQDSSRMDCRNCGFWRWVGIVPLPAHDKDVTTPPLPPTKQQPVILGINNVPSEIMLDILEYLEDDDLVRFSHAYPRVRQLSQDFAVGKCRELQCSVLRESFKEKSLGFNIALYRSGRIKSSFDLISRDAGDLISRHAAEDFGLQWFPQNSDIKYWLPVPLSKRHWEDANGQQVAMQVLEKMAAKMKMKACFVSSAIRVLFAMMNDLLFRLCADCKRDKEDSAKRNDKRHPHHKRRPVAHISEKAGKSYFQLYHILLCIATSDSGHEIVDQANKMVQSFQAGKRHTKDIPTLGHLLIALLISDVEVTDALRKAIITESITRNVVWLLDQRGATRAELGYLESDEVSHYRLKETFMANRQSYRLLMISELFRRTARPVDKVSGKRKGLEKLQDQLFEGHGAPPPGVTRMLATQARRMLQVSDFPTFFRAMGMTSLPGPGVFTGVLRDTVRASIAKGYSREVSEDVLAQMRLFKDTEIDKTAVEARMIEKNWCWKYEPKTAFKHFKDLEKGRLTFFRRPRRRNNLWDSSDSEGDEEDEDREDL